MKSQAMSCIHHGCYTAHMVRCTYLPRTEGGNGDGKNGAVTFRQESFHYFFSGEVVTRMLLVRYFFATRTTSGKVTARIWASNFLS